MTNTKGTNMGDSTATTCQSCEATTSNGLVLCERCQIRASIDLEFLPVYFRNLARWRPGRAGSRPVPASREPRGESQEHGDRVSRALDEVGANITEWAHRLTEDRGIELPEADGEAETIAALSRMFAEHLTTIATREWAGEFIATLSRCEAWLRGLTENVAPGWYAGACRRCDNPTHVVPGLTWVTCGACGVTTYARDHLEAVLGEARDWVAPPKRLAEAIVALVDTELSVPRLHDRIRQWGSRDRIVSVRRVDADGDPVGPKRYRFGEVLDVLFAEGATRLGGKGSEFVA